MRRAVGPSVRIPTIPVLSALNANLGGTQKEEKCADGGLESAGEGGSHVRLLLILDYLKTSFY
jgi:hypothetical protein